MDKNLVQRVQDLEDIEKGNQTVIDGVVEVLKEVGVLFHPQKQTPCDDDRQTDQRTSGADNPIKTTLPSGKRPREERSKRVATRVNKYERKSVI